MDYKFIVSPTPPLINEIMDYLKSEKSGAIFLFNGKVRSNNYSKEVEYLEYEVDKETGEKTVAEKIKVYEGKVDKIIIFQAEGKLKVGDDTIIIGACSYGRKESMDCVNELLEFMKHNFPVWKKEYYKDLTYKWL